MVIIRFNISHTCGKFIEIQYDPEQEKHLDEIMKNLECPHCMIKKLKEKK